MSTTDYQLTTYFERFFLRPLGLNQQNSAVLWLLLIAGAIVAGGLWYSQGSVGVVIAALYLTSIFLLSFLRIDFSLYVLIFGVLFFDQYGIPEFTPFTFQVDYFNNLNSIGFLPSGSPIVINSIEIHLLILIISLFILLIAKRDFFWRPIPIFGPFLFFFCCFIASFLYGMASGGDFLAALWEIRALFYFFLFYLIVPQIIRNKQQIQIVVWIFITAISFKAFQAIGRFIELGFTTGGLETLTNHEDPVFIVTLIVLLLGFWVFSVRHKQRFWLLVLLLPLLLGFYMGMRRAAYASLMVAVATFYFLIPRDLLWELIKYSIPVVIAGIVYSAAFWNSSSTLGRPVQMIKSGIVEPKKEISYQDYQSNLFRDIENYNLAQTVVHNPINGVGFGNKYEEPVEMVELSFELQDYIPHNQMYWVLVKMGIIGFLAFWFFFNAFVAKGVKLLKTISDPYLKVILIVSLVAIINQMVVSFYDLQLTYYRNMIYLGCLMGLMPAIEHHSKQHDSEELVLNN